MSSAKSRTKKLRGAGFDQLFSVRTIAGLASTTNASMRQTIVTNGYENAFNLIGILPPNNGQPLKRPAQVAIINAIHMIALIEVNNGQMSQQQANMLPPITPISPEAVAAFAQNYVNTMPQEEENENENEGQGKKRGKGKVTQRRIAALEKKLAKKYRDFEKVKAYITKYLEETGQSEDEVMDSPAYNQLRKLKEEYEKLLEQHTYWVSVEQNEGPLIEEEEEEPAPAPAPKGFTHSATSAFQKRGKGKCRCNAR